jgi:aminoglycoside phosphotransferase (APT) family kinase protein
MESSRHLNIPQPRTSLVLRCDDVIVKSHARRTNESHLGQCLQIVSGSGFRDVFVQPRIAKPKHVAGKLVTYWQAGRALECHSPDEIDWGAAAKLLATLHALPIPARTPQSGWTARIKRSYQRLAILPDSLERTAVLSAYATLPSHGSSRWIPAPPVVIHGDFHPGQLVELGGQLKLIDIDDVGIGDATWDLSRIAGWRLAGLLSEENWRQFIDSYFAQRPDFHDDQASLWDRLELSARAAVVQSAAARLFAAWDESRPLEDFESDLIETCKRIADFAKQRKGI